MLQLLDLSHVIWFSEVRQSKRCWFHVQWQQVIYQLGRCNNPLIRYVGKELKGGIARVAKSIPTAIGLNVFEKSRKAQMHGLQTPAATRCDSVWPGVSCWTLLVLPDSAFQSRFWLNGPKLNFAKIVPLAEVMLASLSLDGAYTRISFPLSP